MNADTLARIAAWSVIADAELPAGTKVIVKDGWVTIQPPRGQPVHAPYGPADTLESLRDTLKASAQATARDAH